MSLIFVDTSAWFASTVPWDANHRAAAEWLASNTQTLFTTDYVLDETLTLFRIRNERALGVQFGKKMLAGRLAVLHVLTPQELEDGWHIYRDFDDKEWSFTDCTSKAVMERWQIRTAFSFDHHFRQFGSVLVVPP